MYEDMTLLYSEDEEKIRELVTKTLHRRYKNLYIAENGKKAWELYLEKKPDLIVTDIKMPEMNGLDLAEKILTHNPDAKVLITSAHSDLSFMVRAIQIGVSDYILKPIDTEKMLRAIEKNLHIISLEKEKKSLEFALQKSQDNFNIISSLVSEFFFAIEISGNRPEDLRIDWIGGAFEDITNYEINNFHLLTDLLKIVYEQDAYRVRRHISNLLAGKQEIIEIRILTAKNQIKIVRMQSYSKFDPQTKQVVNVYGTITDISQQRAVEQKLVDVETRYQNLIRNTPMGALVTKTNGEIIEVNDAFLNLVGNGLSEIHNLNAANFYADPHDREILIDRILNNDYVNYIKNYQTTIKHKSGRIIDVEITASLVKINGNDLILTLIQDVTVRKKNERELKELADQLAQSDALKGLLFDVITHDLRSQAGNVLMLCDLIANEYPENDKAKLLLRSGDNMIRTLLKASSISKLALGEEIDREEIDINKLLDDILPEYKFQIEEHQIALEKRVPTSMKIKANALVSEVFHNYISNALRYAKEGKKIIIEAETNNHTNKKEFVLRVVDFGETIPQNLRESIFKRRLQLVTQSTIGHGLGLAIVERIAQAHRGKAWVEPNEPRGNIFCFSIPL